MEKLTPARAKKKGYTFQTVEGEVWLAQRWFAHWIEKPAGAVQFMILNGQIPKDYVRKDGIRTMILANKTYAHLHANLDPVQSRKGKIGKGQDPDAEVEAAPGVEHEQFAGMPGYGVSRAKREAIQATQAQMDLDEQMGKLVKKAQVEKEAFALARNIREALLSLPPRCADKILTLQTPKEVLFFLDREIRESLREFCEKSGVDLTGGPEGEAPGGDVSSGVPESEMQSTLPSESAST